MGEDLHERYEAVAKAYKFHKYTTNIIEGEKPKDKAISNAEIEVVEELCLHNSAASKQLGLYD